MAPRLAKDLHGEGPSTALLAAMQEGFATLPENVTNVISEAFSFKSAKADPEISSDEETREEDRLQHCPAGNMVNAI